MYEYRVNRPSGLFPAAPSLKQCLFGLFKAIRGSLRVEEQETAH